MAASSFSTTAETPSTDPAIVVFRYSLRRFDQKLLSAAGAGALTHDPPNDVSIAGGRSPCGSHLPSRRHGEWVSSRWLPSSIRRSPAWTDCPCGLPCGIGLVRAPPAGVRTLDAICHRAVVHTDRFSM
jgi:hypothetical protein